MSQIATHSSTVCLYGAHDAYDVIPFHELCHDAPQQSNGSLDCNTFKLKAQAAAASVKLLYLRVTILTFTQAHNFCRHRLQSSSWDKFDAVGSQNRWPMAYGYDIWQNQAACVLGVTAPN